MTTTNELTFGLEYTTGDSEAMEALDLVVFAFKDTVDSFKANVAARDAAILLNGPFPGFAVKVEGCRIVVMRGAERLFTVAKCRFTVL